MAIPTGSGSTVRLRDVADISEAPAESREISRLDGVESVVVSAQKQPGANSIAVANRLKAEVEQIRKAYPELRIVASYDTSAFVQEMLSDVQLSLILGAILAALVALFFFRDIRNTLVTVAGLPVIVLTTFVILQLLGVTLNEISMLALSLCIGLLAAMYFGRYQPFIQGWDNRFILLFPLVCHAQILCSVFIHHATHNNFPRAINRIAFRILAWCE